MPLFHRIPGPPLSDFVEVIWLSTRDVSGEGLERVLPTGSLGLIFGIDTDRITAAYRHAPATLREFGSSMVIGAFDEHFVIDTSQREAVLGIHFRPGGAFPFLGCPADEFPNLHVSLDAIWGRHANRVRESILEAASPDERLRAVERCLIGCATKPLSMHPAVAFALGRFQSAPCAQTMAAVSDAVGLSQRRFIQLFREQVGFTPKLFCRLQRFQKVLSYLDRSDAVDWSAVAAGFGFYDQSHLINEFQDFSGLSPTAYRCQRGHNPNHVPIRE